MKIGFIGAGKMGRSMIKRLLDHEHHLVIFDENVSHLKEFVSLNTAPARSIEDLIKKLPERKIIWMMVPAGTPIDQIITASMELLKPNDVLIDGGNSFWKETQSRTAKLKEKGIHYLDCAISGGVLGYEKGYCLMAGGEKSVCEELEPVFLALSQPNGYLYCGPSGAGHFVKMIHNGIEYAMMQAYGEGFEMIEKSPFDLNLSAISNVWQNGSLVQSQLLKWIQEILAADCNLSEVKGYVEDSGEGRWAIKTSIDLEVPVPGMYQSLINRFQSRQPDSFAMKLIAALRQKFGGHSIKKLNP